MRGEELEGIYGTEKDAASRKRGKGKENISRTRKMREKEEGSG